MEKSQFDSKDMLQRKAPGKVSSFWALSLQVVDSADGLL